MFVVWHWKSGALAVVALLLATGIGMAVLRSHMTVPTDAPAEEMSVSLPVIMYHGLLKQSSRQGRYVISPELFEQDLQYLQQQGYTTVVVRDLLEYVDNGTPLPDKPIMITFDDGYYNNYLYAYPLLQKYRMKAVISPVCLWTEQFTAADSDHEIYSHITWQEMREMVESGLVEIQNHSYNMHYCVSGRRKGTLIQTGETEQSYDELLREDLRTAQEHFAENVGVTPTAFTYPYGAMCPEALPVIRELGFRCTLTCEEHINRITRDPECLMGLGRYLRPSGSSAAAYFKKVFSHF